MNRILMTATLALLTGCMPAIKIPEIPPPSPIKTISYEFDRDIQKWTKQECKTKTLTLNPPELETACYKEMIPEPPAGVVRGKGER